MTQLPLFRPPRAAKRTVQLRRMAGWERDNLEAARIIAADPVRYDGLPLVWASAVLARNEKRADFPLASGRG